MPAKIDIIILSFAKDEKLRGLTLQTIETLLQSEDPLEVEFNVLVIESNRSLAPYQYPGTHTIYPKTAFGFNKFLNIGIKATSNKYLCLCNNDLVFHKGWASALLSYIFEFNSNEIVLSPFCDDSHKNFLHLEKPIEGYFGYFAGYCFFTTRDVLNIIGPLDEKINFWYSDTDFLELLNKYSVPHYLVPRSKVTHLGSRVTAEFRPLHRLRYTVYPRIYFQYKWEDKNPFLYLIRLTIYLLKYIKCSIKELFAKAPKEW